MPVTIARFDFPYQAQIARAMLDAQGVPAFVADEHTINAQWLYANALGGVRLQVPVSALPRARDILAGAAQFEDPPKSQVDDWTCRSCGSNHTRFNLKGKAWAFLFFFLVEFPIWPVGITRKCGECGHVQPS